MSSPKRFVPRLLCLAVSTAIPRMVRRSTLALLVVLLASVNSAIPAGDANPGNPAVRDIGVRVIAPGSPSRGVVRGPALSTDPPTQQRSPRGNPQRRSFGATAARLLEDQNTRLAELHRRFQAAPDHASALAVQREIEMLKVETELALLRSQAESAREQGRASAAEAIEASIDQIRRPHVTRTHVERPAAPAVPPAVERR